MNNFTACMHVSLRLAILACVSGSLRIICDGGGEKTRKTKLNIQRRQEFWIAVGKIAISPCPYRKRHPGQEERFGWLAGEGGSRDGRVIGVAGDVVTGCQ